MVDEIEDGDGVWPFAPGDTTSIIRPVVGVCYERLLIELFS